MAATGAYSPDGKRMVYAPLDPGNLPTGFDNFVSWRRYRGGRAELPVGGRTSPTSARRRSRAPIPTTSIRCGSATRSTSSRTAKAPMTLFRYDPQSKQVTKLLHNTGKDIVHASAGPGGIVYEQFGAIHIYDLATNKEHPVAIDIMADLTEVRPRFQNVADADRERAHLADRRPRGVRGAWRDPHRARPRRATSAI